MVTQAAPLFAQATQIDDLLEFSCRCSLGHIHRRNSVSVGEIVDLRVHGMNQIISGPTALNPLKQAGIVENIAMDDFQLRVISPAPATQFLRAASQRTHTVAILQQARHQATTDIATATGDKDRLIVVIIQQLGRVHVFIHVKSAGSLSPYITKGYFPCQRISR